MESSVFEKMNDRIIFSIVKQIVKQTDMAYIENSGDWEFYKTVQSTCKLFSIDPSIQDTDFLYNIISMNDSILEEDTLTSKLERPTLKNYEYDWVVTMKTIVNEYYNNTIPLYSDKEDVRDILYTLRSEGTIDIFDGNLYEEDTRDSEMLDDEIGDIFQK